LYEPTPATMKTPVKMAKPSIQAKKQYRAVR
jgi:hypothetical protein